MSTSIIQNSNKIKTPKSNCSWIVSLVLMCCMFSVIANAQGQNIKNDIFWNTKEGHPVYSQGGGVFKFTDPVSGKMKYYWYGCYGFCALIVL